MKAIEVRNSYVVKVRATDVLMRFFQGMALAVRRGLGLGIVLFLALSTLSILNRGVDLVEASLKSVDQPRDEEMSNLTIPRKAIAKPYTSRPVLRKAESFDTAKMFRESRYLLNSFNHFARTLGRIGR